MNTIILPAEYTSQDRQDAKKEAQGVADQTAKAVEIHDVDGYVVDIVHPQ